MPIEGLQDAVNEANSKYDLLVADRNRTLVELTNAMDRIDSLLAQNANLTSGLADASDEISRLSKEAEVLVARIKELEALLNPRQPWDWDEENNPADFDSITDVIALMPDAGGKIAVANLSGLPTQSFFDRVNATCTATGKPTYIEVSSEYLTVISKMVKIGRTTDPNHQVVGAWHPNLRGFVVKGTSNKHAVIQMNPGAMGQDALNAISQLKIWEWNGAAFLRIDSTVDTPAFIGGMEFRGSDQGPLTATAYNASVTNNPIKVPQPAPMEGIKFNKNGKVVVAYTKFLAPGRISTSQPPFETGAFGLQLSRSEFKHVEISGKRSPEVDPNEPKRGGAFMINNEYYFLIEDFWIHDTAAGRIAYNGQNYQTVGDLIFRRGKIERISTSGNNEGYGGASVPALLGFENSADRILIEECGLFVDNPQVTNGGFQAHIGLTSVKAQELAAGKLEVRNTYAFNRVVPALDGFFYYRITPTTKWWNWDATIFHYHPETDERMKPLEVPTNFPIYPTADQLKSIGADKDRNILIRRA